MASIIGPANAIRMGCIVSLSTAVLITSHAAGQTVQQIVGYEALMMRLGAGNYPTGAGVVVAQVEAGESPGNYGPNQLNPEFVGKFFSAQSGPSGNSGHATLVGQLFYGSSSSIAPGITNVFLYEAGSWVGFIQSSTPPPATPGSIKVINHSWIGSTGSASADNLILRRADYIADRDELLLVVGLANFSPASALLYQGFNGISVGLSSGTHFGGPTAGNLDGPGRSRPDITAPGQFTSFATPLVSGACADLVQTARSAPGLSTNGNAQRSEVLKSVLLCGAQKNPVWTNNPATSGANRGATSTPLDTTYGAGTVNINTSHLILTGLEQNGSTTIPTANNITYRGWDYTSSTGMVANRYYRFHVSSVASKIYAVAVWNRYVDPNISPNYLLPNFNLQLWRVNASNQLVSLVGNGGLGVFAGGNVLSQSSVDNVEHLYITGLQPGDYVLNLSRNDAVNLIWDVSVAWLLPKTGDVNGDGAVNIDDLVGVITAWGMCGVPSNCPADVNGSGSVNIDDLVLVITNWG